jgi:RNAse (barnase) inhibitor barstar
MDEYYLHLLEGEWGRVNEVAVKIAENDFDMKVVVIEGEKCQSVEGLVKEFNDKFFFPDYFGFNFDALDECLNDLEWLEAQKYLIFICEVDKVLSDDPGAFNDFIMIMEKTVKEWNQGRHDGAQYNPPTPFDVVFQCENNLLGNELRLKANGMDKLNIISLPL